MCVWLILKLPPFLYCIPLSYARLTDASMAAILHYACSMLASIGVPLLLLECRTFLWGGKKMRITFFWRGEKKIAKKWLVTLRYPLDFRLFLFSCKWSELGRLHSEFIRLLFLQAHRETFSFLDDWKANLLDFYPSTHERWRLQAFLPQLDEFCFTTDEKKILENCRCIVPNFMND